MRIFFEVFCIPLVVMLKRIYVLKLIDMYIKKKENVTIYVLKFFNVEIKLYCKSIKKVLTLFNLKSYLTYNRN